MQQLDITFLGTGDAFSAGGRHQAAYLVRSPGTSLLLDCAPTTLSSIKRKGLPSESIDRIFLSHFHGDHFGGLPFFFLEYIYVEPRRKPLQIIGPPGVEEAVMLLFRALYPDSAAEQLPYPVQFIEAHAGKQLSFDGMQIKPFLVPHLNRPFSLGCEMLLEGRKVVYSGDTGWTEDLLRHTEDADLFICECSFFETRMETHLDYPRLAENHPRFGSKKIVLTHLGREVLRHQNELELETACDNQTISL
jgi:ribonuclease BN (tRNA processing enzyme)